MLRAKEGLISELREAELGHLRSLRARAVAVEVFDQDQALSLLRQVTNYLRYSYVALTSICCTIFNCSGGGSYFSGRLSISKRREHTQRGNSSFGHSNVPPYMQCVACTMNLVAFIMCIYILTLCSIRLVSSHLLSRRF
jgi:hypothetical protein